MFSRGPAGEFFTDEMSGHYGVNWTDPVPEATLRDCRNQRTGPDSFKIGRHVRYPRSEVQRWLRAQRGRGSDVA